MRFLNLTPHAIHVHGGGVIRTFEPSGQVARVIVMPIIVDEINGIPIFRDQVMDDIEGLPDPSHGVVLIVSTLVRVSVPDRSDVVSPGKLIRDNDGKPIGCMGLSRN